MRKKDEARRQQVGNNFSLAPEGYDSHEGKSVMKFGMMNRLLKRVSAFSRPRAESTGVIGRACASSLDENTSYVKTPYDSFLDMSPTSPRTHAKL